MNGKKNNTLLVLLVLAGTLAVGAVAAWVLFMPGGVLANAAGAGLQNLPPSVSVQAPPVTSTGSEVALKVTVENPSASLVRVDEIRLAKSFVEAGIVTAIYPPIALNQTVYEDATGFRIDYAIAPRESQEFEFTLLAQHELDANGEVQVVIGGQTYRAGLRLVFLPPSPTPTQPPAATRTPFPTATVLPSPTALPIPYQAVVQITAKVKVGSGLRPGWVASGTLITKDGLILTNGHMFEKGWNYVDYDLLLISITDNPDLPAEDRYYADLLEADIDRDVALLRIKTDLKYRPVDPTLLNLTYLQIGDASTLKLGDPLIILGYPVIGGNTITLTRGEVAGFQPSRKLGARAWIKTSGNITGGASGGAVLDQFGKLVGIPTQLGGGTASGPLVDCRLIADTNGDGDVDYKDACIPTGGFLNAIRSINLALPMIQKAMGTVTAGQ